MTTKKTDSPTKVKRYVFSCDSIVGYSQEEYKTDEDAIRDVLNKAFSQTLDVLVDESTVEYTKDNLVYRYEFIRT